MERQPLGGQRARPWLWQCLFLAVLAVTSAVRSGGAVCANNAAEGFCASIDTNALVQEWSTAISKNWNDSATYSLFGMDSGQQNALLSALDAAKLWIVATDGQHGPAELSGNASRGGCGSCAAAVAVALQEGGNQAEPSCMVPPTMVPRSTTDPTFATSLLCRDGEKCQSGGIWQVSNAWIKNSTECPVCDTSGCHSIKNPLCAARIAIEWTQTITHTNIPCHDAQGGLNVCDVSDLQNGPDPNCMLGPFCLGSTGWNSPPCLQMYRQASATNGALPFCRLALDACATAVTQLEEAGWKSKVAGSCEPTAMQGIVHNACEGHTTSGSWAMPEYGPGICNCAGKPCLLSNATDDDDEVPTPAPPTPPPTPPPPPGPVPTCAHKCFVGSECKDPKECCQTTGLSTCYEAEAATASLLPQLKKEHENFDCPSTVATGYEGQCYCPKGTKVCKRIGGDLAV